MNQNKIQLPKQVTTKLYVVYGIGSYNKETVSIETHDCYKLEYSGHAGILLAETEITIDISNTALDLNDVKKRYLKTLEAKKSNIRTKYHMELQEVQEQINNLLSIEYKGD